MRWAAKGRIHSHMTRREEVGKVSEIRYDIAKHLSHIKKSDLSYRSSFYMSCFVVILCCWQFEKAASDERESHRSIKHGTSLSNQEVYYDIERKREAKKTITSDFLLTKVCSSYLCTLTFAICAI